MLPNTPESVSVDKPGGVAAVLAPHAPGMGEPVGAAVEARVAEFAELAPAKVAPATNSLSHLLDVTVTVTAELGRKVLTIGDILKLGSGSLVELEREISEPVELRIQGVPLARGEVVVVEDRFAIRIKEIVDPKFTQKK